MKRPFRCNRWSIIRDDDEDLKYNDALQRSKHIVLFDSQRIHYLPMIVSAVYANTHNNSKRDYIVSLYSNDCTENGGNIH